jgi:peptidoglycan/LPS O-acetylase OafA/YrhL
MSHPGSVDIIDFLAFTIYPFIALGVIELISRGVKLSSWKKLSTQGVAMIILSIIYVVFPSMIVTQENNTHVEPLWMSILVMLALAATLFFQARRSKIDPSKVDY